jgi:hypothetical protein
MNLGTLVELIALALAVSGLLLQPKKDPSAPPSWRNLSTAGRIILGLILVAGVIKLTKSKLDGEAQARARERQQAVIDSLQESNRHLIKVMSVSGGYNARLHGVVTFDGYPSESRIEEALRNLFLKFASVELSVASQGGRYQGRVDYGAHPEVYRYLNLRTVGSSSTLIPADLQRPGLSDGRSFYFEVRCPALKILNDEKIQYVRYASDPPMQARVVTLPEIWADFRRLYGIRDLAVYEIDIEELGKVRIVNPRDPV